MNPVAPPSVVRVLQTLETAGFSAYLVGGCVRDTLLGRPLHDFDVTTNATPDHVQRLFSRTVATGKQHGTVTVISDGTPVEVTTYRLDLGYSDGRHPDAVQYGATLEQDLARRDFTINAMALDLRGNLVDPFDGRSDLASHTLRAVGHPPQRFREDGLRILRAFRFAAELGFSFDDATYAGMQAQAERLQNVSAERVGSEVARIAAAAWWTTVEALANRRIWRYLPSALQPLVNAFTWFAEHPVPTPEFPAAMAACSAETRTCLSFAVWCRSAQLTADAARSAGRALRWPNHRLRSLEQFLVILNDEPLTWTGPTWRDQVFRYGEERLLQALKILDVLVPAAQDTNSRTTLLHKYAHSLPIHSEGELQIRGDELQELGAVGPVIGDLKRRLLRAVLHGQAENRKDDLRQLAATWLRTRKD